VTDPNDLTLDPVEDRVRRTFAARAEDMAPGDAAGSLPDFGRHGRATPRRLRGTRGPLLAAAAVVVVATATGGVALVIRDGDREAGRLTTVAEQPSAGEADIAAVTAPRALVDALQVERNLAAATLMGIDEALGLSVADAAAVRSDTDAAVVTLEAFVTGSRDGAAYQSGLDGLAGLDQLRGDVDGHTGPRSMDNADIAQDVFDRYAGIVGGLLDDQQAYAETIDDPVLRSGATAYGRGLRLGEQTMQLLQDSMLAAVLPGTTESVAELTLLHTQVQQGMDTLVADTARTPYAEAADKVVGEVEAAGLLEATGGAVDGMADISLILDAADALEDEGWPAYLDRVEETLAAEG
jgi:hypothetical protein